jgi:hydroxyacylglutathione hydrolase
MTLAVRESAVEIRSYLIGSMRNFVYLIVSPPHCLVVDPHSDISPWMADLERRGWKLTGVLLTHSHHDHIGGLREVVEKFAVPTYLHELETHRLLRLPEAVQASVRTVEEGQTITLSDTKVQVMHTPGHSPGELCYYLPQTNPPSLISGDTVFVGMVGRTDLDGGSDRELFETLQRIKTLPKHTRIYPGHHYGDTPYSTLEQELLTAAFQCKTVDELAAVP